ncbi:hypothetical protein [Pedobacter sp. MW01-1-1]|uniref:hypothetical protein n=1 Tax=Pedobacter sp. MW01-1-1 TaxID=3383027 RepID=UPI003FF10D95
MKKLKFENFGVQELDAIEKEAINGGNWIKKFGWGYVVTELINNWDDIKGGFRDGWNS